MTARLCGAFLNFISPQAFARDISVTYSMRMAPRLGTLPFDLRSLEIFLAVCETGTMAAAARALSLTQPAVSLAVGDLEERMGLKLFDRSVRPLALTSAGSVLRDRAVMLLTDAREIAPLLNEAVKKRLPRLRIGLVDSISRELTGVIADTLSSRADDVSILSGLTADHSIALLTRHLDIFCGVDDMEEVDGLERWPLFTEPYILLMPRGDPIPNTLAGLVELAQTRPLIRYSGRSKTGIEIERHLRRLGIHPARHIEFDAPYGVSARVGADAGFAITTPLCLAESGLAASVQAASLPGPKFQRTITLIARRRELGRIPQDLALKARATLATKTIPRLSAQMTWLADQFHTYAE
ncbi:Transcriptional regulator, LysR family [Candidatus Filomicrobium marinum]|uniref:Transcriptional regulator, LysR family n=2 Tax=Hyphomicrobiaceae TaxID=45401 RepID=A0A0D6JDM9_9HYPH|nr:Transcriptional regulator, LysR family [Candidatus Filomicrobium marinum]CPR17230.1 Transcriptional regulator, LysR family [Candidatus Filomicrobium marinum]